jgi:hypothetical protein
MTNTHLGLEIEMPAKRLLELSQERFYNAYSALNWPDKLSESDLFMSEELISLFGTSVYDQLDDAARRRLSFYEILNFFSMNVHGERYLISGLAHHIYATGTASYAPYLHAFIDEENKHMYLFSNFCMRYGGKIYPNKKVHFLSTFEPKLESLIFFTRVLIFEEILDCYNTWMKDDPNLNSLVRDINRIHHNDEIYHIAFGRDRIKRFIKDLMVNTTEEEVSKLQNCFFEYLQITLRAFYSPDVYRDAGLPEPYALRRLALATPKRLEIHSKVTNRCRAFLSQLNLLPTGKYSGSQLDEVHLLSGARS